MVYNMGMVKIEKYTDSSDWDDLVNICHGHPLQLWGWGEVKSAHNWQAIRLACYDNDEVIGGAQVLIRTLPVPFKRFLYVPRGPFYKEGRHEEVLSALVSHCKAEYEGVAISIEPDTEQLEIGKGWRSAKNTVLLPRTLVLDLTTQQDDLLACMTKKTRQYIRKSTKDGVEFRHIQDSDGVGECMRIYKQTAQRAGFALHDDQYYYDVHEKMKHASVIFGAYNNDELVSFVWLAVSGATAFELYGGMSDEGQRLRANYGLKWHAITTCMQQGVQRYDMNGLLNDGVSNFKQGFAQHENQFVGTYDYPLSPLYSVWTHGLPVVKKTLRTVKSLRK